MKRILLVFGLLLTGVAVNAQTAEPATNQTAEQATPEQRAHTQALKMQKNLGLTAEQTTKVEAVLVSRIKEVQAVKTDATKSKEQKEAAIAKINEAKETELKGILTAEQFAKYKEMQAKRKERKGKAEQE
jgi:periplasmic protein CpxP/Spy